MYFRGNVDADGIIPKGNETTLRKTTPQIECIQRANWNASVRRASVAAPEQRIVEINLFPISSSLFSLSLSLRCIKMESHRHFFVNQNDFHDKDVRVQLGDRCLYWFESEDRISAGFDKLYRFFILTSVIDVFGGSRMKTEFQEGLDESFKSRLTRFSLTLVDFSNSQALFTVDWQPDNLFLLDPRVVFRRITDRTARPFHPIRPAGSCGRVFGLDGFMNPSADTPPPTLSTLHGNDSSKDHRKKANILLLTNTKKWPSGELS